MTPLLTLLVSYKHKRNNLRIKHNHFTLSCLTEIYMCKCECEAIMYQKKFSQLDLYRSKERRQDKNHSVRFKTLYRKQQPVKILIAIKMSQELSSEKSWQLKMTEFARRTENPLRKIWEAPPIITKSEKEPITLQIGKFINIYISRVHSTFIFCQYFRRSDNF